MTSNPLGSGSIPVPLSEGYLFDCLEVFMGEGTWARAHTEHGLSAHAGIDIPVSVSVQWT